MNTGNEKSRGYYKIEGAARIFNFDFKDKVVLDIGSSTGGFTEYALEQGTKRVIAVEKGTNQMKSPLRDDPRVELYEKTDVFDVKAINRSIKDPSRRTASDGASAAHDDGPARSASEIDLFIAFPDAILADISFLSLTKILKYAKINLSRSNTDFLVMLKPQFEAKAHQLNNGIVKNEKIRREIIKNFERWLKANNFIIVKKHDNELHGKHGNRERFYHLCLGK